MDNLNKAKNFILVFLAICLSLSTHAFGKTPPSMEKLMELSFDELSEITVTSVSKKEENLFKAPSAIYVITQKDIRRSGHLSLAELMRLVPGMHVGQVNANTWAISSRGFQERFANKLLVLIDGRTVYSDVNGGVFWDELDVVLEDVLRIEVIRGPGGTLWGANAVNGIINIITKDSKDTKGGLVSGGTGTVENGFVSVRYGDKLSDNFNYRAYGKYYDRDDFEDTATSPARDNWEAYRGGFRIDGQLSEKNKLTFQGDYYDGKSGERRDSSPASLTTPFTETLNQDTLIDGSNVLARFERQISEDSNLKLQIYYNREEQEISSTGFEFLMETYDVDFQHRFQLTSNQELVWGGGIRFIVDSFKNSFVSQYTPASRTNYRHSAFVQDEISLIENRLKFIVGTKINLNNYTGLEFQPSSRILYTPSSKNVFWGAVSRAVRMPTRSNDSVRANFLVVPSTSDTGNFISLLPNQDFESEDLLAFETGYRFLPNSKLFFDLALFYNFYNNLNSFESQTPFFETDPSPSHLVIPVKFGNGLEGETYGVEGAIKWTPVSSWELNLGLNLLEMDLRPKSSSLDTTTANTENNTPSYQWHLRSYLDLPHNLELDTALYHVGRVSNLEVPAYVRWDVRMGWKPKDNIELSLGILNLSDSSHPEFTEGQIALRSNSQVPRSIYGKLTWMFQ